MGAGAAAVPYIVAALAAGGEYVNTTNTQKRQDEAAAQAIRSQGAIQQKANQQVNQTVDKIAGSTSAAAEQQRNADYMAQLQKNRAITTAGLQPTIGSSAFQQDAAQAADAVNSKAAQTAGLMARMDAPGIQRQQEGFDYGKLGTNLGLDQRQSQGQSFMDQIRMNAIHRNAKIDLAAGLANAYAGAAAGGASGAAGAGGGSTIAAGGGYTYNLPF